MFVHFWANAKLVVCSIPTTSPCWDIWDIWGDDMAPIRKGLCTRGWTLDPIPIWFFPTELNICFSSPVIPMLYTTVLSKVAWKDAIPCWHTYIHIYICILYIYIYVCVCARVMYALHLLYCICLCLFASSAGFGHQERRKRGLHQGTRRPLWPSHQDPRDLWRQMLDNYST